MSTTQKPETVKENLVSFEYVQTGLVKFTVNSREEVLPGIPYRERPSHSPWPRKSSGSGSCADRSDRVISIPAYKRSRQKMTLVAQLWLKA
ncbi:hypothetical protein KW785_01025 [Candidatus Parcubacteria bacterium]|nr:hypothetical protein [Candidatus Parcubacteria bacterium]